VESKVHQDYDLVEYRLDRLEAQQETNRSLENAEGIN
jgi:hypothetical protein